jgi:DNA ligase (NAD+)
MMDKKLIINSLSAIHQTLLEEENYTRAIETLNAIRINSLVNYYINVAEEYDNDDKLIIELIIRILQNIYNNSGEESPIKDEEYDKLYEIQRDQNDEEIVGSSFNASDKAIQNHTYTSLRGTLDKIHFMTNEKKGKDKRKSLQDWIKAVENKLGRKLSSEEKIVQLFPKWDGLSGVFECEENGETEMVLTRGDTDKNEALDLTSMFRGTNLSYVFGKGEPPKNTKYGVKTEIIMSDKNFTEFCEKYGKFSSARSAVSSILNSKELDRKYLKYLSIMPLQYQMFGEEIPHIVPYDYTDLPYSIAKIDDYDGMEWAIKSLKEATEKNCDYNIDGIVIRLINEELQKKLGREGRINKYEVAYKFPPEEKKTKLKNVIFLFVC